MRFCLSLSDHSSFIHVQGIDNRDIDSRPLDLSRMSPCVYVSNAIASNEFTHQPVSITNSLPLPASPSVIHFLLILHPRYLPPPSSGVVSHHRSSSRARPYVKTLVCRSLKFSSWTIWAQDYPTVRIIPVAALIRRAHYGWPSAQILMYEPVAHHDLYRVIFSPLSTRQLPVRREHGHRTLRPDTGTCETLCYAMSSYSRTLMFSLPIAGRR